MDIANQCGIEQRLRFDPEIIPTFALTFGIRNQRRDQLQNILCAAAQPSSV